MNEIDDENFIGAYFDKLSFQQDIDQQLNPERSSGETVHQWQIVYGIQPKFYKNPSKLKS